MARAGETKKAQAIMKCFNRKTKMNSNVAFKSAQADFTEQSSEVYNAISKTMAPQPMNMAAPM